MSADVLNLIKNAMEALGLKYGFMEYKVNAGEALPATYFVGEYHELESDGEAGEEDTVFILTGFSREKWIRLEETKEMIKKYFPRNSGRVIAAGSDSTVALFYGNSLPLPVEDDELKKMQINLVIKEWKVEQ
ncbi:hypothetical protein D7X98_12650 [bacterium 1XD8-76]|nr:hypothetical protein D7X98_12650 [bacterium 1XD8-76]